MNTMVISDLDGTLLRSDVRLSEFTVAAVNSLIRRGVNFTYATARSLNSALRLTKELTLSLPVITYNGACIKSPETGEIIEIQSLDEAQVQLISESLDRFGISPLVYTYLDGEGKVLESSTVPLITWSVCITACTRICMSFWGIYFPFVSFLLLW